MNKTIEAFKDDIHSSLTLARRKNSTEYRVKSENRNDFKSSRAEL